MRCDRGFIGLLALVCSCAAIPGGEPGSQPGPPSAARNTTPLDSTGLREDAKLITLSGSIESFLSAFNADVNIPRFVAILSPTCGACRHGAEAIKETLSGDARDGKLRLFVVWAPMLAPDNDASALEAVGLFSGVAVSQFYDPDRRLGDVFRKDVFPRAADEMRQSLPHGHYLEASLAGRSNDTPEWDIYMFFDAATVWTSATPRPRHWVRQIARVQKGQGGLISVMWKDSYALLPKEGLLADQLREMARVITGAGRK